MSKEVFKNSLTILLLTLIVFIPTVYAEKIKTIAVLKEVFKNSLTILLLTLIVFIPTVYAEKIKTIAVLPFKINAAQDLDFLKKGIMDMLSSRLSWKHKVIVVENELVKEKVAEFKGSLNKETALKIGKCLSRKRTDDCL
jgi:hypothetical protein